MTSYAEKAVIEFVNANFSTGLLIMAFACCLYAIGWRLNDKMGPFFLVFGFGFGFTATVMLIMRSMSALGMM